MSQDKQHPINLIDVFRIFKINLQLIWQMTKREVIGRYQGSILGLSWSFLRPMLMLAVYTFVFSVVFKARWDVGGDESKVQFATVLFVGLIFHGLFAEIASAAPNLVVSNVNYVKKVVFPLEILPIVSMGAALFHSTISLLVLFVALIIFNGFLYWTVLLTPIVLLPLVFASLGFAWIAASIGVFIRDVEQPIEILVMILLFISGVFFPINILPETYRPWLKSNPLAFIIEQAREVIIWGNLPDWTGLTIHIIVSILILWVGFIWFQKTRKGFADVL
ncbi:MAG: ABC transporter permease [Nitrospinales bacterium]